MSTVNLILTIVFIFILFLPGFTFSFPMKQHSILSGELITWTKSFKCGGLEGVDVAALLQQCLRDRGLNITVRVLLNDTTGTLVAGAHIDPAVGVSNLLSYFCNTQKFTLF